VRFTLQSAGDVAFVAMEPTLSTIFWGVCKDRVTSGSLESALMYFKPREVLIAGNESAAVKRLLTAFVGSSDGSTLEEVGTDIVSRPSRLQVGTATPLAKLAFIGTWP
jgi:hypothetical protein